MHNIQCNKRKKPENTRGTVKTYRDEYVIRLKLQSLHHAEKKRNKVEAKQGRMPKRINEFIEAYPFRIVSHI